LWWFGVGVCFLFVWLFVFGCWVVFWVVFGCGCGVLCMGLGVWVVGVCWFLVVLLLCCFGVFGCLLSEFGGLVVFGLEMVVKGVLRVFVVFVFFFVGSFEGWKCVRYLL
jgi:hypothetical protein